MSYTSCAMADFGPPARIRRASGAGIAAASSELPGSTLRVWLLEMYAWGLLTPQQVQAISERALHDAREKRISDLEPLARLGLCSAHRLAYLAPCGRYTAVGSRLDGLAHGVHCNHQQVR